MRILLFFSLFTILISCTTVEVVKEVTKAGKSIKTSVDNLVKNSNNKNQEELDRANEQLSNDKLKVNLELKNLKKEKEEKQKIIKGQSEGTKINLIGKTYNEIKLIVGEPSLLRLDGSSRTIRFDNDFCQLFLFLNSKNKNSKIEYFEIRNKEGKLIINKMNIKKCYKSFELI